MSEYSYEVRPADPADRAEAAGAHEVMLKWRGRPLRIVGVWDAKHKAEAAAAVLNQWAGGQIR